MGAHHKRRKQDNLNLAYRFFFFFFAIFILQAAVIKIHLQKQPSDFETESVLLPLELLCTGTDNCLSSESFI